MHVTSQHEAAPPRRAPWYRQLYAQVLLAIVLGALLGHFQPALAEQFKPLGDGAVKRIKRIGAAVILLREAPMRSRAWSSWAGALSARIALRVNAAVPRSLARARSGSFDIGSVRKVIG